ncbi:hypothetical protein D3C76_1563760 [compost metagenome]
MTDDDCSAVECFETATVGIQLYGCEAVVTQAIGTGLDIVDAEYQCVESKNVHGYHSIEIVVRCQPGSPVAGRRGGQAARLEGRLLADRPG